MSNSTKKLKSEIESELHEKFPFISIEGDYTGANKKTLHKCNLCGHKWMSVPRTVINSKHGCPKCQVAKSKLEASKKKFLEKLDTEKFELLEFNNYKNVKVRCKICGNIRNTTGDNILRYGCKSCSSRLANEPNKLTLTEFISRAIAIHGDKYDYSKVNYINYNTKVTIICKEHGEFQQSPSKHLIGQGCPKCCNRVWTNEEFINEAKQVHGDKYDYSNTNFTLWKNKVTIICPKHGPFKQLPSVHIDLKCGCPLCNESHGEMLVSKILKSLEIPFERQETFKNNYRSFKVDFCSILNNSIYIIEYNGHQHYSPVDIFGGEEALIKQQLRDEELRILCKENNYYLLEIPYNKSDKEIESMIKEFFVPFLQGCSELSQGKIGEGCDANTEINSEITKGFESL